MFDLVKDCPRFKPFKSTFFHSYLQGTNAIQGLGLSIGRLSPSTSSQILSETWMCDVYVVFKNRFEAFRNGAINKGTNLKINLGNQNSIMSIKTCWTYNLYKLKYVGLVI